MSQPADLQVPDPIRIARKGEQPLRKGPAEYFTGAVTIEPLFPASDPARATANVVTFEPGARTAWHTHPLGQRLIVTAGAGWVQEWGGPVHEIRPGDVVSIPAGRKHWHGAPDTTAMSHIAVQEELAGHVIEALETVSDAQDGK